jgi:hypothetical protein
MKISMYKLILADLEEKYGDIEVMHTSLDGQVRPAPAPRIQHMCKLTDKQSKAKFWHVKHGQDRRGEIVVEV